MIRLDWKVHTPELIKEILNNNSTGTLRIPLTIFQNLLGMVADRAIKINDKELNRLMIRLTLYENADPLSKDYDPEAIKKYFE